MNGVGSFKQHCASDISSLSERKRGDKIEIKNIKLDRSLVIFATTEEMY